MVAVSSIADSHDIERGHSEITIDIVIRGSYKKRACNDISYRGWNQVPGNEVAEGAGTSVHETGHDDVHVGDAVLVADGRKCHDSEGES